MALVCHPAVAQQAAGQHGVVKRAQAGANLPPAVKARFVKLEQVSEWTGQPWGSMAEFNLLDSTGAVLDRSKWKATSDSWDTSDLPANALDGNPSSIWHTRWNGKPVPPPHTFIVDLGVPSSITGFRYLPRQDNVFNGTIAEFRFHVSDDGKSWKAPVASGDFRKMGAPADEKTVVFAKQTPNRPPRLVAPPAQNASLATPVRLQLAAMDPDDDHMTFKATGLPEGLELSPTSGLVTGTPVAAGDFNVVASAEDGKGPPTSVSFKWSVKPAPLPAGVAAGKKGEVRFVKLVAVSEVSGKPWASIAELNLLDAEGSSLPRAGWLVGAGSSDDNDRPLNAVDDNPATLWHTRWSNGNAPSPPHTFLVDLGKFASVHGFRYLPRQDNVGNGVIAKYRFYVSTDGIAWGRPVAEGDFSSNATPRGERTVRLKE